MNFREFRGLGVLLVCVAACSGQGTEGTEDAAKPGVSTQALSNVTVWKSNWSGASANAYVSTETSFLSFSVWESGSRGSRQANLEYSGYKYDPNSYVCHTEEYCKGPGGGGTGGGTGAGGAGGDEDCQEYTWCEYTSYTYVYGWGAIPADSFTVKPNANGARLSIDLATVSGFSQSSCTVSGGTYSCSDAPGGVFDVAWKPDGMYSASNNGVTRQNWGAYSTRSTGQWDERSAAAVGTALGDTVQASGTLSVSRGNSVSKEVLKN